MNLGGGIGIPYHPQEEAVDLEALGAGVQARYETMIRGAGIPQLDIRQNVDAWLSTADGWFEVLHKKETYKNYVGLDACMANLMPSYVWGLSSHYGSR